MKIIGILVLVIPFLAFGDNTLKGGHSFINMWEMGLKTSENWQAMVDPALELIHLDLNSLEGINEIPHIEKYEVLDLTGNKLTTLKPGMFDSLKRVKIIVLNGNPIQEVQGNPFENLKDLRSIELKNTKLSSDEISTLKKRLAPKGIKVF